MKARARSFSFLCQLQLNTVVYVPVERSLGITFGASLYILLRPYGLALDAIVDGRASGAVGPLLGQEPWLLVLLLLVLGLGCGWLTYATGSMFGASVLHSVALVTLFIALPITSQRSGG